jgi:nucleoside-diphosphate-sugar epimerase
MPRRVLITGVNGFTGRHLAMALAQDCGLEVLGSGRRPGSALPLAGYRPCDLTDGEQVAELIAWARPDITFHLAGCFADASAALLDAVNIGGFTHLRKQLRRLATRQPVRMLLVGSAAEIGPVSAADLPLDESIICRPVTAYGASKHAVVQAALAEPDDTGLEIVVARPFNLLGAGLDLRLAPAAFANALQAVARGETDTIECGWLDARRDYLDIADAIAAYRMLIDHAPPGTLAHVCSGRSVRMGDLLAALMTHAGVRATVRSAPHPREHDIADIRGSHARLTALTGWQPRVPLAESLAALTTGTVVPMGMPAGNGLVDQLDGHRRDP